MTAGTEAPAIGLTHMGSEDTGLGNRGPQSKSIVVPYGFWLFVLSDMVLFSALFATYASLVHATDGGPTTGQLFHRELVAIETIALLVSSFVFFQPIISKPTSGLAHTLSWLPFSAPIVMPLRMAVIPVAGWEVAVALISVAAGSYIAVWVAARIYRTGMLMYGKRPTMRELARWLRAT